MRSFGGGLGVLAVVLAVVAAAACGSSSPAYPGAQSSPSSSPAATSGGDSASVVKAASNATLGSILVDRAGTTLYTLTNAGSPVACTGQCLTFWPPLLLPSGDPAKSGGAPLYHFSGDKAAGDANGEGISSFGGTWHVVKAPGAAPAPTAAPPATTAPTQSSPTTGGGGGYYP